MSISSSLARRALTAPPPQTTRILLVEDCKSDVFLVERLLEDVSARYLYEITDVPRLVDAFSRLSEESFDLVMLDLNLLDIDGVSSVAALKAEAPGLPILVYSGMDDVKMKEKALMCGATHYLVKGHESAFGLKHVIDRVMTRG